MSENGTLRAVIACGIFTVSFTAASHAVVIFQDGFETYTGATNVTDTGDLDPGSPPTGGTWDIREQAAAHVQVYDSPVTGAAFNASGSDKFLHMTRTSDLGRAWAPVAAYDSTTNTQVVITARMYNHVPDGVGGHTGLIAFNSAPEVFTGRLFDISFRNTGSVIIYDGIAAGTDGDAVSTTIANAYNVNAWNDVRIDIDFTTDTYSLLINNNPITTNDNWEGGNLSTFQHLLMDVSGANGAPNAGWDDITITASPIPEPASLGLLGLGGAALFRHRRQRASA